MSNQLPSNPPDFTAQAGGTSVTRGITRNGDAGLARTGGFAVNRGGDAPQTVQSTTAVQANTGNAPVGSSANGAPNMFGGGDATYSLALDGHFVGSSAPLTTNDSAAESADSFAHPGRRG
jgi:hypothetical protein